jgi:hypothetical protein
MDFMDGAILYDIFEFCTCTMKRRCDVRSNRDDVCLSKKLDAVQIDLVLPGKLEPRLPGGCRLASLRCIHISQR